MATEKLAYELRRKNMGTQEQRDLYDYQVISRFAE